MHPVKPEALDRDLALAEGAAEIRKIVWFMALLGILFGPVLMSMGTEWLHDEDMGHGLFVPFLSIWIAWQKRAELAQVRLSPSRWGLVLIFLGWIQLIVASLGAELFLARTAFLVSLVGVILAVWGAAVARTLAFPLFLLLFMIRIPAIVYTQITFPLQLLASSLAELTLGVLGIPVLREGNVLELPSQKLSVVEACSGIRSLLSLSFLSLVYGYFFEKKTALRAVLFVATVPIAIAANALRVTVTGVLSEYKREWAEGAFHAVEGWVIFMIALVLLVGFHRCMGGIHTLIRREGH